jgi:allantoin racemase
MPKVLVIVPFPFEEEGLANRREQLSKVQLNSDFEFHYRPVRGGPANFDSYHDWLLADLGMLEAGLEAQAEGYDAVCIDTTSDSGMNALRSVLDIPVIAPGKASYLLAMLLGHKFGVLTQWDPWIHEARKALAEYGLADHCVGIESIDLPPDMENLLGGKEEVVFPLLLEAAQKLVSKGADSICLGSTTMHQVVPYLQEHLPVPVIDPGPLTYKMAELLIGMGLTHSRTAYARPHTLKPELIHGMLDAALGIEGSFKS